MTEHEPLHPFDEDEVRLAANNYEAQEWLTRELFSAFEMSGLEVVDVARLLDLEVDVAQEWLSGDVDLSMSDLRHLATALDAHVTYRVEPIVNRLPRWLDALHDGWREVAWVPDRLHAWQK